MKKNAIIIAGIFIVGVAVWFSSSLFIITEPNWDAIKTEQQLKVINLESLVSGEPLFVKWRANPYVVMKLHDDMHALNFIDFRVCDLETNYHSDIVVLRRINTVVSCVVSHVPKSDKSNGGYLDQCKGYEYDFLGRYLKPNEVSNKNEACAVPNLPSPKYRIENGKLVIYAE